MVMQFCRDPGALVDAKLGFGAYDLIAEEFTPAPFGKPSQGKVPCKNDGKERCEGYDCNCESYRRPP